MEELKLFNIFNHCFISPIHLHLDAKTNRYDIRVRNLYLNAIILMTFIVVSAVSSMKLVLEVFSHRTASVIAATTFILYTMQLLFSVPLVLWTLVYNEELKQICQHALTIVGAMNSQTVGKTTFRRTATLWLLAELSIIVLVLLVGVSLQSYAMWQIFDLRRTRFVINLAVFAFQEFVTMLHLMHAQCWVMFLSHHYGVLVWLAKNSYGCEKLLPLLVFTESLEALKQRIISTFGVLNVLLVLDVFVTCSAVTYAIFYIFDVHFGLTGGSLNVPTLFLYSTFFYVFAKAHDLVGVKEAELKSTLKSMQYANLKQQSRDQKDFYDLVNIKLMMESPKITACGLFEINLQIFYNVFAAIITYIVILFQFRGFEKS
ncbi:uncharacterized protein LOC128727405 [Anopheles nili]|uniref:uncharacterized protein LOC128727405 n=1 Tax=Anopheles nili TaxID=185578 RepID=UPI00237B3662|nr:uncharacterized protein LOC128727405 [Anopheles nili]